MGRSMSNMAGLAPIVDWGRDVGRTDRAMARLAILITQEAAKGGLAPEDAKEVLATFTRERRKKAGLGVVIEDLGRQQVSKVRRFIEAGNEFGQRGVAMLKHASSLHFKDLMKLPKEALRYEGEYNGLIEVARAAVRTGHVLTDEEIKELLTR